MIESRLRRVHELLDEAEGLGPVAAKTLLGSEKDDLIIREGLGLSPLAVVEKLGRDIAGSPETVRRVRRARGRSMKDGSTLDERREQHHDRAGDSPAGGNRLLMCSVR